MRFEFESELWRWQARSDTVWVFASVPEEVSDEIQQVVAGMEGGFGSVRVDVTIGATRWRTSIFPSDQAYVLPIKKAVRAAEGVDLGDVVTVAIELVDF
ncbi:DUF1905 domain-containing protein [Salinibacterium sp. SYSU T00001]|uniref:DUF1905 domain-containing protein n=1 Tax=Homoserinimonas sedimenticola TaxID=2986805 RepID=UPI0022359C76|nr:DUF1905 domain-containing protein [Salinibacterium sedimenticola]MCW4384713.1 DUF1905 domain-containing protein [Salinibacterium sedimenticola]